METVLVDSSVWVNFFRDAKTKANTYLNNNFTNIIIATCPVIMQEVLQGIVSDKDKEVVQLHFNNLNKLLEDPYAIAVEAADLYRYLRKKGVTIRKPNDCLIAAYAIRNDIMLLEEDRDFRMMANHCALKLLNN